MELRHLRYFIAVVEAGSFTLAAGRLHTSQPSLSRQIRDLEEEVGESLLLRNPRGVQTTAAGQAFLAHARTAVVQVEAAREAARRAAHPSKPVLAMGFLTGQELRWLPRITRLLADRLSAIELSLSSNHSPLLAEELRRGRLDVAFMRAESDMPELAYRSIAREPLIVVMPSDHPLAADSAVEPSSLAAHTFINVSGTAPAVRRVIDAYLEANGLHVAPAHDVDNLAMAMSLISSTRGISLLPEYATDFLPRSVTSRPLRGDPPMIDFVAAWDPSNRSTTLKSLLERLDDLSAPGA
ncbi:LysR family transcriptional regulator [Luteibacter sp. NPDC031894]|uniref:LysR family transcriptional regulator n=1 Tax=Luteibacter sp. NPDC031894 TaxID=3390572 RepID=UPI003CFD219C